MYLKIQSEQTMLLIYPKEFKIPKDEIIQELQNNGYSVTEVEDCLEIR